MNNKNLENNLNDLQIEIKNNKNIEREKFTTNLDKEMLEDYRELCRALKVPFNEGIEIMFKMLSNNKEYLKEFLNLSRRL